MKMTQINMEHLFKTARESEAKPDKRAKNFVLSPNDIERVEHCEASRVYVGPKQELHPGQWFGLFVHRYLEYCTTRGRNAALQYIRSKRNKGIIAVCERLKTEQIPEHGIAELTVAITPEEGTAEAIEWDMAESDKHVVGRSDLVFPDLELATRWHVWDYKAGNKDRAIGPKGNMQLMTNALGIQLLQGAEDVAGSIVTIDSKSGDLLPETKLYSAKLLRKHLERVKLAHYMTLETRADFYESGIEPAIAPAPERCWQCRAKTVCHGAALIKD